MESATKHPAADTIGDDANQLLEKAKAALSKAKEYRADRLEMEVDSGRVCLVRLRDCLIGRLRRSSEQNGGGIREALGKTNVALSLVVGVEYPATGIKRNLIDEAEKVLDQIKLPIAG